MAKIICACPRCRSQVGWIDVDAYVTHLEQTRAQPVRCRCKDCVRDRLRSRARHPTSRDRRER